MESTIDCCSGKAIKELLHFGSVYTHNCTQKQPPNVLTLKFNAEGEGRKKYVKKNLNELFQHAPLKRQDLFTFLNDFIIQDADQV